MSQQALTELPPEFPPTLHLDDESPHFPFFFHVRNFLLRFSCWDFPVQTALDLFHEGLNNAIRMDIYHQKMKLNEFRSKLSWMENAFENLHKAYEFFDKFDQFANNCFAGEFQWQGFQAHVEVVKQWADYYQQMLRKIAYYPLVSIPMWPLEVYIDVIIPAEDVEKMYKSIEIPTDSRSISNNPNHPVVEKAHTNFSMAKEIYAKLIRHLHLQFKTMYDWLNQCLRWVAFRRKFQQTHDEILAGFEEQKNDYESNSLHLKSLINERRTVFIAKVELQDIAQRSMAAVASALETYRSTVDRQKNVMMMTTLEVYHHVLVVLKRVSSLATSPNWPRRNDLQESDRLQYVRKLLIWKRILHQAIMSIMRMRITKNNSEFGRLLIGLRSIYFCVATFVICYHRPY